MAIHGKLLHHHDITGTERIIKDTFLSVEIYRFCGRVDRMNTHHVGGDTGSVLTHELGDHELVNSHHATDGHVIKFHDRFSLRYTGCVHDLFPKQSPSGSARKTGDEILGGEGIFKECVFINRELFNQCRADHADPL